MIYVFDMDGTLVDSNEHIHKGIGPYFEEHGIKYTTEVQRLKRLGIYDCFEKTWSTEDFKLDKNNIEHALIKANKAGADTTQFFGAIRF